MPHDAPVRRLVAVVGAAIERDGLVLCAQRGPGPQAGLWEFPGGKVEPGETPAEALAREIAEELGCTIEVGDHVDTSVHRYDHVSIELAVYRARITTGEPTAHEHAALAWRRPAELHELTWAPADLPAVDTLQRMAR